VPDGRRSIGSSEPAGEARPLARIVPPLARMFCPVIQRASSMQRRATTSAMSCGCPSRPNAAIPTRRCFCSSVLPWLNSSVSVGPGETMTPALFTRMSSRPKCSKVASNSRTTSATWPTSACTAMS
jgi:hypothetical protein